MRSFFAIDKGGFSINLVTLNTLHKDFVSMLAVIQPYPVCGNFGLIPKVIMFLSLTKGILFFTTFLKYFSLLIQWSAGEITIIGSNAILEVCTIPVSAAAAVSFGDGSIIIPDKLRPYMNNLEKISLN